MKIRPNVLAHVNTIMFLMSGQHSTEDLCKLTGLALSTMREFIALLHAKKLIHVARRGRYGQGGWNKKFYTWGAGEDVMTSPPAAVRRAKIEANSNLARSREIKQLEMAE